MAVGVHQHRRHQLLGQQRLRAVEVGQHGVEQRGALDQPRFDHRPFVGRDDEGQRVEGPARLAAICVEQVERRARFLELAARALDALAQALARQGADHAQDALPVIADRLLAGDQLVVRALPARS